MKVLKMFLASFIPLILFFVFIVLFSKFFNKKNTQKHTVFIKFFDCVKSVICGILSFIPVFILSYITNIFLPEIHNGYFRILFNSFILSSLIEESMRLVTLLFFLKIFYKNSTLNFLKVLMICTIAGLSFGCFENIIYGITSPDILYLRLFTAVLLHGACGAIFASGLIFKFFSASQFSQKTQQTKLPEAFFIAWASHGLYNLFCQLEGLYWISISALVLLFLQVLNTIKNLSSDFSISSIK